MGGSQTSIARLLGSVQKVISKETRLSRNTSEECRLRLACCVSRQMLCRVRPKDDSPTERFRRNRLFSRPSTLPEEPRGEPNCSRPTPDEDE